MNNIPHDQGEALQKTRTFLADLISRRDNRKLGHNNIRTIELNGGKIVEPTAFEPDASTYRDSYYYNALTNVLYRKVVVTKTQGLTIAHWVRISQ